MADQPVLLAGALVVGLTGAIAALTLGAVADPQARSVLLLLEALLLGVGVFLVRRGVRPLPWQEERRRSKRGE